MKISTNFSEEEWVCHCGCGQNIVKIELINMMEKFRKRVKKPIIVHCVNRCQEHNDELPGSSKKSLHIKGMACDFHVRGMSMKELYMIALSSEDILTGGIGLYDWGIHVDIGKQRTWDNRNET